MQSRPSSVSRAATTVSGRLGKVVLSVLAVAAAVPAAAEAPPVAREAFANMPRVTGEWAFTRSREDNDGSRVERFDPSAEAKWQLLSVDGREPTEDELRDYAEEIERRLAREGGRPGDNDFDGLAAEDGWELLEEDEERITWRFRPAAGATDREDMAKHLQGEMTILKSVPYVESFRLYSDEPFRAKVIAKIERFDTRIEMIRLDRQAYMPARVTTEVRGSAAFGLKSIARDILLTYSDFRYAGSRSADKNGSSAAAAASNAGR
ncbi:hypothetical protein [Lentisalinibacter sediminis]|uniref:hypothetical protein n=1 Tax=Lentisalinibacter sediminis TaxID=2992237 RepID=UPI0038638122